MEAEYIALSQAMRELIPLLGILEELTPVLKLNKDQPHVFWKSCGFDEDFNSLVANLYEDNAGAYELAKAPKIRPRTKHIALKYHHFREHVSNGTIKINLIGTRDQIAETSLWMVKDFLKQGSIGIYFCDLSCHVHVYTILLAIAFIIKISENLFIANNT
jgi:hypothetical protein